MADSRVSWIGVIRRTALVGARGAHVGELLALIGFTTRSLSRVWMPMIMPFVQRIAWLTNMRATILQLPQGVGHTSPSSWEISARCCDARFMVPAIGP